MSVSQVFSNHSREDINNTELLILEEQSMRDGLQREATIFSIDEKIRCFELLQAAGLRRIQAGSFVNPRMVPQMADTDELVRRVIEKATAKISVLILNEKGLMRALECGVPGVSLSVSVSNAHSLNNVGKSAEEALNSILPCIKEALASNLDVRAELQCVFGCIHEGAVKEDKVLAAAEKMIGAGAAEISLADTTGMALPADISRMIGRFKAEFPHIRISLHLHDTRGLGLANIRAGYEAGVRRFDVCAGGLGGCPFIKGAPGNVATEDAVDMLEKMSVNTGIDLLRLGEAVQFYEARLKRKLGTNRHIIDGFSRT
ncbi:MAG: hydroxymethylglutaryl-CoA lyase [Desulfamplus sp.]|nr:hydroxymethylglutaryl-CoA lyase [Desulfamplus sp.]